MKYRQGEPAIQFTTDRMASNGLSVSNTFTNLLRHNDDVYNKPPQGLETRSTQILFKDIIHPLGSGQA
jgi:hypothetical protein